MALIQYTTQARILKAVLHDIAQGGAKVIRMVPALVKPAIVSQYERDRLVPGLSQRQLKDLADRYRVERMGNRAVYDYHAQVTLIENIIKSVNRCTMELSNAGPVGRNQDIRRQLLPLTMQINDQAAAYTAACMEFDRLTAPGAENITPDTWDEDHGHTPGTTEQALKAVGLRTALDMCVKLLQDYAIRAPGVAASFLYKDILDLAETVTNLRQAPLSLVLEQVQNCMGILNTPVCRRAMGVNTQYQHAMLSVSELLTAHSTTQKPVAGFL